MCLVIRIGLRKLLGERSLYWLSVETGIRWGTLARMAKGKTHRLDLEALEAICRVLECEPGELLVLQPKLKKSGLTSVERQRKPALTINLPTKG